MKSNIYIDHRVTWLCSPILPFCFQVPLPFTTFCPFPKPSVTCSHWRDFLSSGRYFGTEQEKQLLNAAFLELISYRNYPQAH